MAPTPRGPVPHERRTNEKLPVAAVDPARNAEWHVINAGKEIGRLTLAELIENAANGEEEADDLVKQNGGL